MLAIILHVKFLENRKISKLIASLFFSFYFTCKFNLIAGQKKCPECYGSELCQSFQNKEIHLTWLSYFLTVINPNLSKGVFYGILNGSEIVVKRKSTRGTPQLLTEMVAVKLNEFQLDPERVQNVILCPGVRDLKFLFSQIEHQINDQKLWLDLRNSIEPLLLMYFQSETKWPVPRYHGACGDLIVEEYKGQPLINFLSSEFKIRAYLAIHLLRIAHLFTFSHPTYSFYFTDYSFDNMVADSDGNVFLIDLDNVIISNKTANEGRSVHRSQILDDSRYAFSAVDICSHLISDHNFFSVCKYLLSNSEDGLLKEIPKEVEYSSKILHLLEECSEPKMFQDRFSAGWKLEALLEEVTSGYNWSE